MGQGRARRGERQWLKAGMVCIRMCVRVGSGVARGSEEQAGEWEELKVWM